MESLVTGRLGLLITAYLVLTNMTTAAMSFNSPVFTAIDAWFYACKLIIIAAVFEFAAILKIMNSPPSVNISADIEAFQTDDLAELHKRRVRSRKVDANAFLCFNILFALFCIIYGVVCSIMGGEI